MILAQCTAGFARWRRFYASPSAYRLHLGKRTARGDEKTTGRESEAGSAEPVARATGSACGRAQGRWRRQLPTTAIRRGVPSSLPTSLPPAPEWMNGWSGGYTPSYRPSAHSTRSTLPPWQTNADRPPSCTWSCTAGIICQSHSTNC